MELYIGIDVGKFNLDVCYLDNYSQVPNEPESIVELMNDFNKNISDEYSPIIVCEATGGYEKTLVQMLHKNNFDIHVAHPNKIRSFAKTKGILAKTDKIDAAIIRDYGAVMKMQPSTSILSEQANAVRDLMKRRDQLLSNKHSEQARLDKDISDHVRHSIESHLEWILSEINNIEKRIKEASEEDEIKKQVELLTSVPAVGNQTALMLISYLPELGQISSSKISALVGVAPFNRDSGQYRGKRFIQGGRSMMRKAIYMSALASVRWNPDMREFYTRLRNAGKPAKVALVAVMRKLLVLLNSIMKRQTPWEPHESQTCEV